MTVVPGLLVLHLLSDRNGRLGALLIDAQGLTPEVLQAVADQTALADLTARRPCLFDPAKHPDTREVWLQLGATALALESLAPCDAVPAATLAANLLWFPGQWYLQPPPAAISGQSASRTMALRLMQLVANDADNHEIEEIFRRDPTLSYHLLRLVNSVSMGLNRKITSFSQAIILIGRQQLRRWLNFILFAARDDDPRSTLLLARVATRARTMELLAKAAGRDKADQDQAFMTGMFSLLGVLFGQPLAQVLEPLKLSPALSEALLAHEGWLGELFALVECSERGDLDALAERLRAQSLPLGDFVLATVSAHRWMLDVLRESEGPGHG